MAFKQKHYVWDPQTEAQVRNAWNSKASTCYTDLLRDIKQNLVKPTFLNAGTWRSFKYYWAMLKYTEKQKINKKNRFKVEGSSTQRGGSISHVQHAQIL